MDSHAILQVLDLVAALGEAFEEVPESLARTLDQVRHHCQWLFIDDTGSKPFEEDDLQLLKGTNGIIREASIPMKALRVTS